MTPEVAEAVDLQAFDAGFSADLQVIQARQVSHDAELERCFAEDGFPYWLTYVTTEWEEAPGRTVIAPYPAFDFLTDYRAVYQVEPYSATDKSRGMLASTDPLLWDLWQGQRIAYQNVRHNAGLAPWRGFVQRQSEDFSIELLARAFDVYDRLPDWLRLPLGRRNLTMLETAGGGIIRAFHAGETAGRGDGWDHGNIDEMAFQHHARESWQSFDRVRLKQATSTPRGRDNLFSDLVHGKVPGVAVVRLHYTQHPDRRPGTVLGDAWIALKRSGKTEAQWQQEYECNYDVFDGQGYYTADYNPACVRQVKWDGSMISLGMDYSYLNPAASWYFVNEHGQVCRLGCELRHEVALPRYCQELFERIRDTYPKCQVRIAPDPFRGRQHHGGTDLYDEATTDIHTIQRVANEVFGCKVLLSVNRTGRMTRKEGHRDVRRLLGLREDNKFGTIIDPSCIELIQGFAGAYGPKEGAIDTGLEEADERRECIHVMDADRYAVCEFVQADRGLSHTLLESTANIPLIAELVRANAMRRESMGVG